MLVGSGAHRDNNGGYHVLAIFCLLQAEGCRHARGLAQGREGTRAMTTRALPSGPGGSTEAPEVEVLHVTTAPRPTLRLHLWLENKGELFFGIGRARRRRAGPAAKAPVDRKRIVKTASLEYA